MSHHTEIIKAAQARQVASECWILDRRVAAYVVRDGEFERLSLATSQHANVSALVGDREGYVSCSVGADPDQVVDAAIATAKALPAGPEPLTREPRTDEVTVAPAHGADLSPQARQRLVEATQRGQRTSVEVRLQGEERTVVLAGTDGLDLRYHTGLATATVRVTARADTVVQLTQDYFAPSLEALVRRLCDGDGDGDVAEQADHATLLARTPRRLDGPPPRVLVHGRVASRILSLLCPAMGVDWVVQGRSLLADGVGTTVAGQRLSVTDDMTDERCPLRVPWDDEGTGISPVPLIKAGVLQGFLADRRYAGRTSTDRTGSGWRGEGGQMPTIRPGCLVFELDSPGITAQEVLARDSEPVLYLIQANGMHMANEVTGDFSFAASGLLYDVDGSVEPVSGLTVAGNLYELLRAVGEHDGHEVLWRHELSFVSSPGIWAPGLAVGQ
jgi:PmbA protein